MSDDGFVVYEISSTKDNLVGQASGYTVVRATNEFIKNHYDAKAHIIRVEVDIKNGYLYIYGDGTFMDVEEMLRIIKHVNESNKGDAHMGLGRMSFPRLGTKLTTVSKNSGMHTIMTCRPGEKHMISDVGPVEMGTELMSKYSDMVQRIRKFHTGSVDRIEGLGKYNDGKHSNLFNIQNEFNGKFEGELKRLNYHIMNTRSVEYKHGDNKSKRLRPKPGRGEQVKVKIDRRHPHPDGREFFTYNGHKYRLSIDATICMGQQNGDYELLICKDGCDMIPLVEALNPRRYRDLVRGLCCIKEKFFPYLAGVINMKFECLDDGPDDILIYTRDRCHFTDSIMRGEFGTTLVNLLMYIETDYIKDFLDKILEDKSAAKISWRDKDLEQNMYNLLSQCSDILKGFDILKNVNEVNPTRRQVDCKECTCSSVPIKVISKNFDPEKVLSGNIYHITDTGEWFCGSCKSRWKNERKSSESHKTPVYEPPESGTGVERKKRHGISYRFKVVKFLDPKDTRFFRVMRSQTLIEINGGHPDYISLVKARGEKSKAARLHTLMMAVRALFSEIRRLNPEVSRAAEIQYKESIMLSMAVTRLELGDNAPVLVTKDDLKGAVVTANKRPANNKPHMSAMDSARTLAEGMGAKLTIKK